MKKIIANAVPADQKLADPPPAKKVVFRENYYKYESVKGLLEEELQTEQPVKDIVAKLHISTPTFHKYKNFLQIEKGRQYVTSDERAFQKKLKSDKPQVTALSATQQNETARVHGRT